MKQPAVDDLTALARKDRVHRRVYTDPAVFELELQRIFNRAWLFAGHESQVPRRGDFITTQLAGQTLFTVRHEDEIKVLFNRCRTAAPRSARRKAVMRGRSAALTTAGCSIRTGALSFVAAR